MFFLQVTIQRRLLSIVLTTFLPTLIVNIVGHMSNYFKEFFFEGLISTNVTVLLVITTLFIRLVFRFPYSSAHLLKSNGLYQLLLKWLSWFLQKKIFYSFFSNTNKNICIVITCAILLILMILHLYMMVRIITNNCSKQ